MSQELKYKVGDRVRVTASEFSTFGEVGVIDEIDLDPETELVYLVDFGHVDDWYREPELTRAASSPDEQDIENAGGSDPVNHPSHYTSDPSGVECIEITRHRDFLTGSAIKYLWRAGLKDSGNPAKEIEDLKKAAWYIQQRIELLAK